MNMFTAETIGLDPSDPEFADRIRAVDIAFLAIAGQWAEDGKLQGLLDTLGIPYTGSGVLASAAAMHKPTAKALVSAAGVKVLPHVLVREGDGLTEVAQASQGLAMPVILKPRFGKQACRAIDQRGADIESSLRLTLTLCNNAVISRYGAVMRYGDALRPGHGHPSRTLGTCEESAHMIVPI